MPWPAAASAIFCTETSSKSFFINNLASASISMRRLRRIARIRRFALGLEKLGHFYIDESIPAYIPKRQLFIFFESTYVVY